MACLPGILERRRNRAPSYLAAQFVALIAAVVGGSYWVVSRMATKDDVAQLGLRVSKLEDSIQEVRTTLAVLKDRSDREQKKPNP
jgi:glycine cleavage system regulatory protein